VDEHIPASLVTDSEDEEEDSASDSSSEEGSGSEEASDDEEGSDEEEEGDDDEDEEDDAEDLDNVKIAVPVAMWVSSLISPHTICLLRLIPCPTKDFNHCDPKRCSGKRLARHGLITSMRVGQRFRGVSLT